MKKETIRTQNIVEIARMVRKVKESDGKTILAVHLYLHACMHKEDVTAVAAGLQAGRHLDEQQASFYSPIDCLLGAIVAQFGFDTVAGWTEEELIAAFTSDLNAEVAEKNAREYIKKDMSEFGVKKETSEETMTRVLANMNPDTVTQH